MKRTYLLLTLPLLLQGWGCTSTGEAPAASALSRDEMMTRMTELAAPGAGHRRLEPLEGQFRAKGTFWMEPGEPVETEGISSNRWILGGRFLQQSYQTEMTGQPFNGVGWTGFNNATQEYEGVWVDSMGSQILQVAIGTCDATGKVITFHRNIVDPLTGKEGTTREVLTIVDNNHHIFEWFQSLDGEDEQQGFRIDYTRK